MGDGEERHRPRIVGHKAGVDSVRRFVETARSLGIEVLTLYAFSTEKLEPAEVSQRPDGIAEKLSAVGVADHASQRHSSNCLGLPTTVYPRMFAPSCNRPLKRPRSCHGQ
jgi:undecaprenyl pyrophosphate synthase